jgi:CheY-like chemotaxis protein
VLVVDDSSDAAASTALLVQLWGHAADTALDGPAALRLAEERTHRVVLLDLAMPGMDGCELARRLRRLPRMGAALLVCVSGYTQEAVRRQALEAGCDFFLIKPVNPEQLRLMLDAVVRISAVEGVASRCGGGE